MSEQLGCLSTLSLSIEKCARNSADTFAVYRHRSQCLKVVCTTLDSSLYNARQCAERSADTPSVERARGTTSYLACAELAAVTELQLAYIHLYKTPPPRSLSIKFSLSAVGLHFAAFFALIAIASGFLKHPSNRFLALGQHGSCE